MGVRVGTKAYTVENSWLPALSPLWYCHRLILRCICANLLCCSRISYWGGGAYHCKQSYVNCNYEDTPPGLFWKWFDLKPQTPWPCLSLAVCASFPLQLFWLLCPVTEKMSVSMNMYLRNERSYWRLSRMLGAKSRECGVCCVVIAGNGSWGLHRCNGTLKSMM